MNVNLLKSKYTAQGFNQKTLAKEMEISESCLSKKMSSKHGFRLGDVSKLISVLSLTPTEVMDIFFAN